MLLESLCSAPAVYRALDGCRYYGLDDYRHVNSLLVHGYQMKTHLCILTPQDMHSGRDGLVYAFKSETTKFGLIFATQRLRP